MRIFMVHEDPWHAGNPYISTLIEETKRQHPECVIDWEGNVSGVNPYMYISTGHRHLWLTTHIRKPTCFGTSRQ